MEFKKSRNASAFRDFYEICDLSQLILIRDVMHRTAGIAASRSFCGIWRQAQLLKITVGTKWQIL